MVWGYEAAFTIEHDRTLKKKIDCRDCVYYESEDKSCMKTPKYLPEDGYGSWRKCKFFKLNELASNYETKLSQYNTVNKKKKQPVKSEFEKGHDNSKKKKEMPLLSVEKAKKMTLIEFSNIKKVPSGLIKETIYITTGQGVRKKLMLSVKDSYAYIHTDAYPKEYIECLKKYFKKYIGH